MTDCQPDVNPPYWSQIPSNVIWAWEHHTTKSRLPLDRQVDLPFGLQFKLMQPKNTLQVPLYYKEFRQKYKTIQLAIGNCIHIYDTSRQRQKEWQSHGVLIQSSIFYQCISPSSTGFSHSSVQVLLIHRNCSCVRLCWFLKFLDTWLSSYWFNIVCFLSFFSMRLVPQI